MGKWCVCVYISLNGIRAGNVHENIGFHNPQMTLGLMKSRQMAEKIPPQLWQKNKKNKKIRSHPMAAKLESLDGELPQLKNRSHFVTRHAKRSHCAQWKSLDIFVSFLEGTPINLEEKQTSRELF